MKAKADWRKNSNGRFTRTTALLLISALLCPLLLLKPTQSVSAKSGLPGIQTPAAPASAPPEPFVLSSTNNTISAAALSSVTTFGSSVSSGYTSVAGFFTAPQIPAEFEGAKAVSPFSGFLSSTSSSITSSVSSLGSFFGFVKPAAPAAAAAAMLMSQPRANVQFDFDGDHKADIGSFHRATAEWKVRLSSNNLNAAVNLGSTSSIIAPGDFDGDGITDAAVFNNGTWTVRKSSTSSTITVSFGQAGDKPEVGDYDGDGKSDYAIFRPSTSTCWYNKSSNNTINSYQFGQTGDIPVVGDYDGDLKSDFAVYRPSVGDWYVMGSTAGFSSLQWGAANDIPVPADYDGDGKTDRAVFRGSTGQWFIAKSSDGGYLAPSWGNYGDQPVPADYDGDGKADVAVFRPTNTAWYITRSTPSGGFDSWNLGVPDDAPVEAAYLRQIGGEVYSYDFAKTRLSPKNATGGTNLYSRNFSWGTGLVGLSGRAGLDAGFGISYNSLVWTKQGSAMVFDADKSNVAPGFRFGYPTIEPVYYNGTSFNYLMITPSGAKVEFRQQQGASNVYETADSSYAQLKINGTGNPNDAAEDLPITVTTTDGTQMSYSYISGAYRCTQIKDANGNFITIFNDEYGLLRTVTDTLGRVITINYDANLNLTTITQTWKDNNGQGSDVTHTYATFTYGNQAINTNFNSDGITTIYGPQGVTTKVLQSIQFADGGSTYFDYNNYGQVYKVRNNAADNHELNSTRINLTDNAGSFNLSAAQSDCPRFTETATKIENFNGGNETVVHNDTFLNQPYNVGGASGTATKIEVSMENEPNAHKSETFVEPSGWKEGLPIATEDWANENNVSTRKRWTWTSWTQDDPTKTYIVNPRIVESKVGDTTNIKRTTIDYITQSGITLPNQVKVYDSNQTTVLKTSLTDYNWNSTYLSRRIVGLPAKSELYDQNSGLMSKVTYAYDAGDFSDTTLNQNLSSAIQHDNTNYGASFAIGRGNLTSTTRWDVNYPTDSSQAVTSSVKYNTTGAAVAQITPGSDSINPTRTVKIDYADAFNDNANRNAFAYPTKLTDPAGNFSLVKYRFDIGANVWAKSPAPANNASGKETSREFDSLGRLLKQTLLNTGAYTRYDYAQSDRDTHSKTYSTVIDTDNNGASATDEVLSEAWTDGAGRVRQSKTPLRFNTSGAATAWAGTIAEYDALGQVKRQSIPTEVDANFNAAGDDLTRGFLWTSQEYDWKGRTTRTVNTDGTDKLISYDGCGCAGGQVTTVKGENITETDWQGNATANLGRRTQKIYADILGRAYKTEIMNWDGTTPYTTAVTGFNGRDQAVSTTRYKGAAGSADPEATTFQYDGHGRLKQQHSPSQDAAANVSYAYFNDDSVQTATDGRGASVDYTYGDARGLLTRAAYSAPVNSGIQVPDATEFGYDALGNRTWMTDSLGRADYAYDSLSHLTQETRTITNVGAWTLSYEYGLSGQLKAVNQPDDATRNVGYEYDRAGSLKKVSGGFANVPYYVDGIDYRAFGAAKSLTYGSGKQLTQSYNNLMQLSEYKVADASQEETRTQFDYYADGRVKFVRDKTNNQTTSVFDRRYGYDQTGRTVGITTGAAARDDNGDDGVFSQNYYFDEFNNLTGRDGMNWAEYAAGFTATYQHYRRTDANYEYDADGRNTRSDTLYSSFDAAGRRYRSQSPVRFGSNGQLVVEQGFDGDGQRIKQTETKGTGAATTSYQLRSSVLGGAQIAEIRLTNGVWQKAESFVYAAGETIAQQTLYSDGGREVRWIYTNPITQSKRGTAGAAEVDALGVPHSTIPPPTPNEEPDYGGDFVQDVVIPRHADMFDLSTGCTIDGMVASCDSADSVDELMSMFTPPRDEPKHPDEPLTDPPMPPKPNPFGEPNGMPTAVASNFGAGASQHSMTARNNATPQHWGENYVEIYAPKEIFFSSFLRGKDDKKPLTPPEKEAREIINKALAIADSLLANKKCSDYLKNELGLSDEEIGKITQAVRNAEFQFPGGTESITGTTIKAEATPHNQVIYHNSFFKVAPRPFSGGNGNASYGGGAAPEKRETSSQAQILIHEGIHLVNFNKFTDFALANKIRGDKPEFTDQGKASEFLQAAINQHCK